MNCGFIVPPAAGTDLPNFSAREIWQPFLGGFRMYVQVGDDRQFADWASAVKAGKVFVSSGPIVQLAVEGVGPGGTVRLPAGGGEVLVEAELSAPDTLSSFEIIQNGKPVSVSMEKSTLEQLHSWKIRSRVRIDKSCWLAARGEGNYIPVYETNAVAHTAAIKVIVGDEPINSTRDAALLIDLIRARREYYLHEGRYKSEDDRHAAAALFDRAIEVLIPQLGDEAIN